MNFLIAAYTSIWAVLAVLIFVLMKRNRSLVSQVSDLEERLNAFEKREGS